MVALLVGRTPPMADYTARRTRRRSAGEGSVYPRTDGKPGWRGAVTWTDPDGTKRRRVVAGRTQVEARDRLDALRTELRLGTITAANRATTVGEYLTGWIDRNRGQVKPSTWIARESHVRCYLIPALGRGRLTQLTAHDVERALGSFVANGRPVLPVERRRGRQTHAPISPLTARHIRATLRSALADAVRSGLVGRNVAADARPPYVPDREVEYLSADEVRRLLDEVRDHPFGPIAQVAAATGMRRGEILALRWPDLKADLSEVRVRQAMTMTLDHRFEIGTPKTVRSRRTLPLPAMAREALAMQRDRQAASRAAAGAAWQDREGIVFTDDLGRQVEPDAVSRWFSKHMQASDVPAVTFRDLRHSAATIMLGEGVPLAVVSAWLGHSGMAITMKHYAAVIPQLKDDAAGAMDRALRAPG
jgi:integrase